MNFENIIQLTFPGFLEGLVSIIVFYSLYAIYIKFIYLEYESNLFKKDFDIQLKIYSLCDLAGRNPTTRKDAQIDIKILQEENESYNKKYSQKQKETNEKNEKALTNIWITISVILGTFMLFIIFVFAFKYYDFTKINYKLLLMAFVLHIIFIISLQYFFLYIVIDGYYTTIECLNIFKPPQN
jgi:hypothetical protein